MSICPKCGKEISEEMQFCPGCGADVSAAPTNEQSSASPIENQAASQPYTTVQYTPGYEQAAEQPKKKTNKLIPILAVVAVIVIGAAVGVIKYFTGDSYRYKKAVKMLTAGNYETAFDIFYNLGNYEDSESYLPFHGKYISVSTDDERYLKFTDGEYEEMIPGSDEDSYYNGTYVTDECKSAVITDEDGDTESYKVYKNYIYESESEDMIFDEKVDISSGYFNGTLSEMMTLSISSSNTMDIKMIYSFENDGTYKFTSELYYKGIKKDISSVTETGTYEIDGDFINLTDNEDDSEKSFLVIEESAYRSVYVRNY